MCEKYKINQFIQNYIINNYICRTVFDIHDMKYQYGTPKFKEIMITQVWVDHSNMCFFL